MLEMAALLLVLALVAGLFIGIGTLVFGSPSNLWEAVVLCFTKYDPDA